MAFEDESLYAVIGIPIIFVLGLAGSLIPSVIGKCFPNYGITKKYYFSFFTGGAAGIILAVGVIHSLADAIEGFESVLTDDSQVDEYPWALFICMMAMIMLFAAEETLNFVSRRFGIKNLDSHGHNAGKVDNDIEDQDDASSSSSSDDSIDIEADNNHNETSKQQVADTDKVVVDINDSDDGLFNEKPTLVSRYELVGSMLILFIGLLFHNVFVGLAMGFADNDYVLFIAIICHQFFEGLGMGARVALAQLPSITLVIIIDLTFAAIPVIFIGVGVGIKHAVAAAEDEDGYNIAQGIVQALSAGVLIYVALLHLMRAYQESNEGPSASKKKYSLDWHSLMSFLGFLAGAAIMAVIGIWA